MPFEMLMPALSPTMEEGTLPDAANVEALSMPGMKDVVRAAKAVCYR